jgi:hypothetical protein
MDLDKKNIQAIALMYKVYWEEKNIISLDEFYDRCKRYKSELIETFRKKIQMCEICFYKERNFLQEFIELGQIS